MTTEARPALQPLTRAEIAFNLTTLANQMTRAGVLTVIAAVPPNQTPIFCCNFVKDDNLLPEVFGALKEILEHSISTVGFDKIQEPRIN